jgi:Subtilase family/von Willebrand factor type A domain
MERVYYVRDRRFVVEEIPDIVAVHLSLDEGGQPRTAAETFGASAIDAVRDVAGGDSPNETLAAFERANWRFVKPSDDLRRSLAAGQRGRDAVEVGKVIRRADGSVAVATNRLNVQLRPDLSEEECQAILAETRLEVLTKLKFAPNLYEVAAQEREDALAASVELHNDPRFIFAEPSLVEHIPQRLTPSDPRYAEQWQWNNTSQSGGTAGADVSAEDAWDITRGAGIRVAVIDNGFDADHEDLAAGVSAMSGYFSSSGGAATFTQGTTGMPDSDHGTFCAGMVGARHNNSRGGCGAAPECELMLIAALPDQVGTQATLARAVAYAGDPTNEVATATAADGADILVSSLGPNGAVWNLSATLELALEAAAANGRNGRGLAIFWAASNGNNVDVTQDEVVSHADVIAVVRSTHDDLEDNAARGPTVGLIAPGVDVVSTTSGNGYGTDTGTSYAAPCAAGCAALALSMHPDLTRDGLRRIMRDTADQIGGVVYDANGHNDDYGFGRVNAQRAVHRAARRVELLTTHVVFNDVPEGETTARAIAWQCFGFEALTFQIISGPTTTSGPVDSFSTLLGNSITIPAPGVMTGETARLWLGYTGATAGASAVGTVRVRCVETGEAWDVALSANTIARPTVAVALVLDQSGSMDWDAGDGRKRVEVLREAAQTFVDVLQPDNGIGIVRFDHDAYPGMSVTPAGPEVFGAGRAAATAAIASHGANPAGATSIGDGVELAGTQLDAVTGYDRTAMIVLTDGQENAPKLIATVAGAIDDAVFAIGLGAPEAVHPAALTALTNGAGGYVVMTGVLSPDEYFVLSKYYLQILAGVTNEQIVLDPQGHLRPAEVQQIPVDLTEADAGADVILLTPAPEVVRFRLLTPAGDVLVPGALPAGVKYAAGRTTAYYRFTLPVVGASGQASWAGRWTVQLEGDRAAFARYLASLEHEPKAYQYVQTHGLRYAVEVHARSSLKLTARLHQDDIRPGATMKIAARLVEYGMPVTARARVIAEVSVPGAPSPRPLVLIEAADGLFQGVLPGAEYGLYRVRVVAAGTTLRGARFSRETTLTGAIYQPRPPEDPRPPQVDDRNGSAGELRGREHLVRLVQSLEREPPFKQTLYETLNAQGVDPQRVVDALYRAAGVRPHPLASPVTPNGRRAGERPRGDVATALRQLADQLEVNEERL